MTVLRKIWDAKGSILLAFLLAVVVWVASVTVDDPTIEQIVETTIPIDYSDLKDGLLLVGDIVQQAQITLRAPQSIWEQLSQDDIRLAVDLSQLDAGTYRITLQPEINLRPALITAIEPSTVTLTIEPELSRQFPIEIDLIGEPALGYDKEEAQLSFDEALAIGPESAINSISLLQAQLDIEGARQSLEEVVTLIAIDASGAQIRAVSIEPQTVKVSLTIEQGDRYRLVSVIPTIEGSADYGYRITSIQVIPDQIILTSSNPDTFDELGGFVETEAIDLTGARETLEHRAGLTLPEGLTPVGNQSVLVRVTITAIVDTRNLEVPIEFQGLDPALAAESNPEVITVLLTGPLAILEALEPADVRVVLNLVDYARGSYVLTPEVIVGPTDIETQIVPESVEVTIGTAPPATPPPAP